MATYIKENRTALSMNFESTEFDCKGDGCCSKTMIEPELIERLQNIRDHFGRVVLINSAYRCVKHNAKISGASNSKHLYGQAADIKIIGIDPLKIAQQAESIGIKGIGLQDNFVHVDTRKNRFFWKGKEQKRVSTFGKQKDTLTAREGGDSMTATKKRQAIADKYKTIIGRNHYSQAKRGYCFKQQKDGKYYSDCSSSIAKSYSECGYPFSYNGSTCPNTVGMYLSKDLVDVPVVIKKGIIQNPDVLRVGDMLLFAGNDSSRAYAGQVGHVEMVYKISSSKVTICGHGSGKPSTKELNAYCKSRQKAKSQTELGHKGLIRVRRLFTDEMEDGFYLKQGCKGVEVYDLQEKLVKLGYDLGNYGDDKDGVDGEYGSQTVKAIMAFQQKQDLEATGIADQKTMDKLSEILDCSEAREDKLPESSENKIQLKAGSWNLRIGPGSEYAIAETAKGDSLLAKIDSEDWIPVKQVSGKRVLWISKKAIME